MADSSPGGSPAPTCSTCPWFDRRGGNVGLCRANPASANGVFLWPEVGASDWCAEHPERALPEKQVLMEQLFGPPPVPDVSPPSPVIPRMLALFHEVNCRREHGAAGAEHLQYVEDSLKELLMIAAQVDAAEAVARRIADYLEQGATEISEADYTLTLHQPTLDAVMGLKADLGLLLDRIRERYPREDETPGS